MPLRHDASWSGYPALAVACAVAAGIFLTSVFDIRITEWLLGILAAAVAAAAMWLHAPIRRHALDVRVLTVAGLAAALCAGGVRSATYFGIPAHHALLAGRADAPNVEWTGRIWEPPVYSSGRIRFALRLRGSGPSVGLMVSGRPSAGTVLERCDAVVVRGRLQSLPRPRNPGDFDYGRHLARRRIYALLYLEDGGLRRVGRSRAGPVCGTERVRIVLRNRLAKYIHRPSSRAVLQALLLGDRRALADDVREQFARMGLLHLLAVSGLHVMVVGMIFYRLLGPSLVRLGLPWRTADHLRTVSTTGLLVGYMLLTGCSASVVRAVVMTLLFLCSTTLQRPARPINTLGVAVVILLIARPSHLFEAGFQLSVSAVASILVLVPRLAEGLPSPSSGFVRYVHTATRVTAAATMGTLPVVLYHFGQVGLAGLLLNLPSIPITTAALTAGTAAVTLGGVADALGEILGTSADLLAGLLLQVAAHGDRTMSWTVIRWRIDDPSIIAFLVLLVVSAGVWKRPRARWGCLLLALALLCAHLGHRLIDGRYRPQLEVIVLDVGQGDAILLRMPDGDAVLVDAGPRTLYSDAGSRVIIPQLMYHGVERLSTVVVTHPDSDHLGGLPAVLRAVPVGRVIRSGFIHDSALFDETDRILDSLDVRHETAQAGDTLSLSRHVRAYVLHPPESFDGATANAHSIVLLVRFGRVSILLAGDAPAEAERGIVRRFGGLLKSDLLKVGHHGSRTSSSAAFLIRTLQRSEPAGRVPSAHAVVSVARGNRYGLPDEDVLVRLRRTGFQVTVTSDDGAAWFRTDGRRLERVPWRAR